MRVWSPSTARYPRGRIPPRGPPAQDRSTSRPIGFCSGNITRTKTAAVLARLPKSSLRNPNIPLPTCGGCEGREPRPGDTDGTTVPGTSTCRATRLPPVQTPPPPKTLRHRRPTSHLEPHSTSPWSNSDRAGMLADCCSDECRSDDRRRCPGAGRRGAAPESRHGSSPPVPPRERSFATAWSPTRRPPCSKTQNSRVSPRRCGNFGNALADRCAHRSA
jgi:hypothetical protein